MKKIKFLVILCATICLMLSGCSLSNQMTSIHNAEKPQGVLLEADVRQFTFNGNAYTIVNDTVLPQELGAWLGAIGKLAYINKKYEVLKTIEFTSFDDLKKLTVAPPDGTGHMIPFLNIYMLNENEVAVDVYGKYHVAKVTTSMTELDEPIDFSTSNVEDN